MFRQAGQLSTEVANAPLPDPANGSGYPDSPSRPSSSPLVGKRRRKRRDTELPELPPGLAWPEAKFNESGMDLIPFLEEYWLPLIEAGIDGLRWLRRIDKSAAIGIESFERINKRTGERKRLPEHLRLLKHKQLTDRNIDSQIRESGLSGMRERTNLADALLYRIKKGYHVPNL